MIYTLTPSCSIDYFMKIDHLHTGELNRAEKQWMKAGGKGINVARILHLFDLPVIALGFDFGKTGNLLNELLSEENIPHNFYHDDQFETRINVKILNEKTTELNGVSLPISKHQLEAFEKDLFSLTSDDLFIISGKMDPSFRKFCQTTLYPYLNLHKIPFIVDCEKQALLEALPFHPFLIKPNRHEFNDLFNTSFQKSEDRIIYAKKLQELGAKNIMITLDQEGAILIDQNQNVFQQSAMSSLCVNPVGAGDASVAGFIIGYLQSKNYEDALKMAMCCGYCSCQTTESLKKEDILSLYQQK